MARKKYHRIPSEKAAKFIDAFLGEAKGSWTDAARIAGYKGASAVGKQLYLRWKEEIEAEELRRKLASGDAEMQQDEILTGIAKLARTSTNDTVRLNAYKVLAQIEGLLTDKLLLGMDKDSMRRELEVVVGELRSLPPPIDAIESEFVDS